MVKILAAAPDKMTAHMYGCEMRCLVVELSIECVNGQERGFYSKAPGVSEWGGQLTRGRRP